MVTEAGQDVKRIHIWDYKTFLLESRETSLLGILAALWLRAGVVQWLHSVSGLPSFSGD